MDFELISSALPQLLSAVDETLLLAGSALALGFFVAIAIAVMSLSNNRWLNAFSTGYIYTFRSTPLLVQIFLIYYGSGQFRPFLQDIGLWILFKNAWFCAILSLTLNTGAYTAMIIKGGLESVPFGQIEAARAIGMSTTKSFLRIIFPIAFRQALPAYSNEIILMVKATSLASTITILEITAISKKIIASTFQPIEVFLIAGSIYLVLNFVITRIVAYAERRLNPHVL